MCWVLIAFASASNDVDGYPKFSAMRNTSLRIVKLFSNGDRMTCDDFSSISFMSFWFFIYRLRPQANLK